jgi:hypothetical protein
LFKQRDDPAVGEKRPHSLVDDPNGILKRNWYRKRPKQLVEFSTSDLLAFASHNLSVKNQLEKGINVPNPTSSWWIESQFGQLLLCTE